MGLKGYSKGLIDIVDVVNDFLNVPVGGLFAFKDLDLTMASICEVFNKFSLCVESVSDRTD
jgi:hypothetical protein